MSRGDPAAVVIGSGPNGLAAGITLARAGLNVAVMEGSATAGGGMRTAELTLPGFRHDICSAIHPFAVSSPFFKSIDLSGYGLHWIYPPAALAHPLADGSVIILERSVKETAMRLGEDEGNYLEIVRPLLKNWDALLPDILGPLKIPANPSRYAEFAMYAVQSALGFNFRQFRDDKARALFAGLAAHSMLALDRKVTAGVGLVLALTAHHSGWPFPAGGAQSLADALVACLRDSGGEIFTGRWIEKPEDLPPALAVVYDVTPRQLLRICRKEFPESYRRRLSRFRYGAGIFKVDWALGGSIPYHNPECLRAATVHIGGDWQEIAAAEEGVWRGEHPEKPFVILTQPSLFDSRRAPPGKHTAWAYCHVPSQSTVDMTEKIENQIERFAPGFRRRILARHTMNAVEMEHHNPNYVGGDINGGVQDWRQLFTRPVWRWNPYTTPHPGIFLCSSSTPPGGGVHGMCGYHAARTVLKKVFNKIAPLR